MRLFIFCCFIFTVFGKVAIFPASLLIAAADAFVSVLASVALFTTLYGCGLQGEISSSGIITAFSVYPAAIVSLFKNPVACGTVGALFYFSLSLMAVQSGVSMLEAALSPVIKKSGFSRAAAAAVSCAVLGVASMIFATTAADAAVEIADLFVNFYNVLVLCILECLVLGRKRNLSPLVEEINRYSGKMRMPRAPFGISVGVLCPAVLILLAVPQFLKLFSPLPYPHWAQFAFGTGTGIAAAFAGFAADALFSKFARARGKQVSFKKSGGT